MTRCSAHWRIGCYLTPLLELQVQFPCCENVFDSISAKGIHVDIFTYLDRNVMIDTMESMKGQVVAPPVTWGV